MQTNDDAMTTDPDALADAYFAARPRGSRKLRTVRKGSHVVLSANGLRKWPHGKWFIFVVESNRRGTVHMRRDGFDWFVRPDEVARWRRA